MPRPTELASRLTIARMARLGATAPEIARQLELPVSTVRDLIRRAAQAESSDRPVADLNPRYDACGRHAGPASPLLEAVLALRRQHPGWGAVRIRIELAGMDVGAEIPSDRTLQRWLRRHGLAPAPSGRRRAESRHRAQRPHAVWQVDAADQKRLATGEMISWLRVVNECSGAALHSRVFPPGLFRPGARRAGAGRAADMPGPLGPAAVAAVRQRQSLGVLRRSADAAGVVADRVGSGRGLDPAADTAGQRRGGARPGGGLQLGRAGPMRLGGGVAAADGGGGPDSAGALPAWRIRLADGGVPRLDPFGAAV